jgi:hypothetical protein
MFAIVGESLIRYTHEVVLPRIDAALAEVARGDPPEDRRVGAAGGPPQPAAGAAARGSAAPAP